MAAQKSAMRKVVSWRDQTIRPATSTGTPKRLWAPSPRSPLTYFREVADDLAGHIIAECEAGRQFVHVEVLTQLIGKAASVSTQSSRARENRLGAFLPLVPLYVELRRRHALTPCADFLRVLGSVWPEMRASLPKLDQSMILVIDITKRRDVQ